jgi:hypothetical protein
VGPVTRHVPEAPNNLLDDLDVWRL